MIDNLTEAIAHAKAEAREFRSQVDNINKYRREIETGSNGTYTADIDACKERASKHEQLVAWLTELQERREADRWIPVSERLPNTLGVYNVTRKIIEGETSYVISDACYFDGQNTWHADAGVNHGRPYLNDIIAWRPRPEPYIESEAK